MAIGVHHSFNKSTDSCKFFWQVQQRYVLEHGQILEEYGVDVRVDILEVGHYFLLEGISKDAKNKFLYLCELFFYECITVLDVGYFLLDVVLHPVHLFSEGAEGFHVLDNLGG